MNATHAGQGECPDRREAAGDATASRPFVVRLEVTGSEASPVWRSQTMARMRRSPGVSPQRRFGSPHVVYVGRGGVLFTNGQSRLRRFTAE